MQKVNRATAIVYVDALNLYRRALKGTAYRWLNLGALIDSILPQFEVLSIKYFTTRVKPSTHNPSIHIRQETYLRALSLEPRIEIHFGKFQNSVVLRSLHPWQYDESGLPLKMKVKEIKEKGSDVNLCAELLNDAHLNAAEILILLTNDSDQIYPLKILIKRGKPKVGLILPSNQPSKELLDLKLDLVRKIRPGLLALAQFPLVLIDEVGSIQKPQKW